MLKWFKRILGGMQPKPSHNFLVGDLVFSPYDKKHSTPILAMRPSEWGLGQQECQILLEKEPFPYLDAPNQPRKIWLHESWLASCQE